MCVNSDSKFEDANLHDLQLLIGLRQFLNPIQTSGQNCVWSGRARGRAISLIKH